MKRQTLANDDELVPESERLEIDRDDLDGELVRQPQLYWEASEEAVLTASRRDFAKEHLEQTDADLFKRLRIELAKAGEKDTDTAVKAAVERHQEHIDATTHYLETAKEAALADAFKWAVDQRSRALRELASLYVSGYFSVDSVRGKSAGEAREAMHLQNRERMRDERRRRREGGGD